MFFFHFHALSEDYFPASLLPKPTKLRQLSISIHDCKTPQSVFREEIMLIHIFDGPQVLDDALIQFEQVEQLTDPGPADPKAPGYLVP